MEEKLFVCKRSVVVRFSDLDPMGHVNNANYLSYLEEGRAAWYEQALGLKLGDTAYPVILARMEIDFVKAAMNANELRVLTRCVKLGSKSIRLEGIIMHNNEMIVRSECVLVFFDYTQEKSVEISREIRRAIVEMEPGLAE